MTFCSNQKEHILKLANFIRFTSSAKVLESNDTKIIGSRTVVVSTVAVPRIPNFGEGKQLWSHKMSLKVS